MREAFDEVRAAGMDVAEAQAYLGVVSSLMPAWDRARVAAGEPRHHLRHAGEVEAVFWSAYRGGAPLLTATGRAGVGRSTGYRWLQTRFLQLREDRVPVRAAARALRLDLDRARAWEADRQQEVARAQRAARAARHEATVTASRHAQELAQPRASQVRQVRHARYWQLIG